MGQDLGAWENVAELRRLLGAAADGAMLLDAGGRILDVTPELAELVGLPEAALRGLVPPYPFLEDGEQGGPALAAVLRRTHRLGRARGSCLIRRPGARAWRVECMAVVSGEPGPERHYTVFVHDSLGSDLGPATALRSREGLVQGIERLLATRDGATVLAVEFDIRGLVISLGHDGAEQIVSEAAVRLRTASPRATIGRFSPEVLVLAYPRLGRRRALARAAAVQNVLAAPAALDGHEIVLSTAVGVVDGAGPEASGLVRDAVVAARSARGEGGGVELFDRSMRLEAVERLRLEADLRHAIADGTITLHFQPIIRAELEQVVAFEALARWPRRGPQGTVELVPPARFIPLAEETDLIRPLGRHVLASACDAVAHWNARRGDQRLAVSVNLSSHEIAASDLADFVEAQLERTGIAADQLSLELTESALLRESPTTVATLTRLRDLGVWLILDDFGTGFASLSMLKRVMPRVVKLDRTFVAGADAVDEAIIAATVQIAGQLGAAVVAEGVETEAQFERVRALSCQYIQGFLIAPPLDFETAAALAERESVRGWSPPAASAVV